jgi:DNA-binding CsgD family transcriptional regulator
LFIFLELVLSAYLFVRLFYKHGDRRNWLPFTGLLLLMLYNGTIGWVNDIFRLIVVNMVTLVLVSWLMLLPLFTMRKNEKIPKPGTIGLANQENFVENCKKYNLSAREIQVADLVSKGYRNREIASDLFISERTVDAHVQNIYAKVGERTRVALINKLNQ